jgi:hypothetical protein
MIKFCVILKKTATETFQIFKSAYGKECLSRKVCSHGIHKSKKYKNLYKTINEKVSGSHSTVTLRPTVSRPISLRVRPSHGIRDQFVFLLKILFRQFRVCYL